MSSEKYQIIFATGNQGKIREIKAIVEENKSRPVPGSQAEAGEAVPEIEVLSMKEAGVEADPDETGQTFEENALIKARTVCKACGEVTIPAW